MDKVKVCCVCGRELQIPVWWKPCQRSRVKSLLPCCSECYKMVLGRWNAVNVTKELGD